jgi:hypothetical protein
VVLLPEADALLEKLQAAGRGLTPSRWAHVSLLYPGPITTPTAAAAIAGLGACLPLRVTLGEVITGDGGFLGLAAGELEAAVAAYRARFTNLVAYRGTYGDDPPAHLTLATGATHTQLEATRAIASEYLPVCSRLAGPYFVQLAADGWAPVTHLQPAPPRPSPARSTGSADRRRSPSRRRAGQASSPPRHTGHGGRR